jgi:diguanylate cyclase (GGDEF)-like protein
MQKSMDTNAVSTNGQSLLDLAFEPGQLYPVYQPIVRLDDLEVVAHEGLMRLTGNGCSPLQLLAMARATGRLGELETLAARVVAQGYDYRTLGVHLTVNLSAQAILQNAVRPVDIMASLSAAGMDLGRFVIELTEHDIVDNSAQLAESIGFLRASGIRIALDDFGNGHSNFEMWHQIAPEFVKVDRYLIDGISTNAGKLAIVKGLVNIAATLGAELIAEGIEQLDDLVIVRDLGIGFGQGYLLGRPQPQPVHEVLPGVAGVLTAKLPVHPQARRLTDSRRLTAAHFQVNAPTVTKAVCNNEVADIFQHHADLHAVAVVEDDRPVGIINRREFTEQYAKPFIRELHGRKSCSAFMNEAPVLCEFNQSIDSMIDILRGEDQRYLSDGFVITEGGVYRGLGTGQSLVRRVTEQRIEAARYANPLTFLPGNIPVTEHIDRLLADDREFVAAYLDLNHFKPFNDQYGYFRGDKMILMVAAAIGRHANPTVDFSGHIGGDDFIILFQSDDWERRCWTIIEEFNQSARSLFDADDLARNGLHSEDRQGNRTFFPLSTLTIGAAVVRPGGKKYAEEVASLAAAAKRKAKRHNLGFHVELVEAGGARENEDAT